MLEVLSWVLVACAVGSLSLYLMGFWATLRHVRQPAASLPDEDYPPITLVKPIKGDEEALADNLRTFLVQDYPAPVEIVFASTEPDDPGMEVARQVAAEHPEIKTRFVQSDPSFGLNPKVSNLAGAVASASHDLVLQSDANVRVRRDYLRRVVAELETADASLLTSMVVGVEERSVGAALENLQLSAFVAPGMCLALHLAGIHCVIGKSMLLRRSELAAAGGLAYVRDILAEDFILGERYKQLGKKMILSPTLVENVNRDAGLERFVGRHSRWLKMRAVIHVPGFVADIGANPVALLGWAWVLSGFSTGIGLGLLATSILKIGGDALFVRIARGHGMRLRHAVLAPLKDTVMGIVWLHSIFSRSVEWRGKKLRIGRLSRLRPDDGALPVRVLRRLFAS
jgi:ceramide glucosyltransferase